MLYGQGGSGGIVNAIGKRPRFSPGGHAAVEYGSFDHKQVMFDYTSPLNAASWLLLGVPVTVSVWCLLHRTD